MAISCFLPWAEISSSLNLFGVSASYRQSAMGIQTPLGVFTAVVSVVAILLTFFNARWVIIPACINFLIALVTTIGLGRETVNVSSSLGQAYAGAGIGAYILLVSSIVLIILSLKAIRAPQSAQQVGQVNSELEKDKVSSEVTRDINYLKPPSKKAILKTLKVTGIVLLICIGGWFYWQYQGFKEQEIEDEKYRMSQMREQLESTITAGDHLTAVSLIGTYHWDLKPDEYQEYANIYKEEKKDFQIRIDELKRRVDSIEVRNDLLDATKQQEANAEFDKDNLLAHTPSNFPFIAMVSPEKCFVYAEPNVNAERKAELTQETTLNIMAAQNEFFYCNYQTVEGRTESGWVYYNVVVR